MSEGIVAIVAATVGAGAALFGESLREGFTKKRRATYLAMRTVIALDSFVSSCASALSDSDDAYNQRVYENPDWSFDMPDKFQIPDDVDWTSIDPKLTYGILRIPKRDAEARAYMGVIWNSEREVRDEFFLPMALDAAALADQLRSLYDVPAAPPREGTENWDPVQALRDRKQKLEDRKQEYENRKQEGAWG